MASPKDSKAVNPPETLPADFFDKQGGQDTLPANFDFGQTSASAPPQETGFLPALKNFGIGAAKELTSTATSLPMIAGMAINRMAGMEPPQRVAAQEKYLQSENPWQTAGKTVTGLGEILVPAFLGARALREAVAPYESPMLPPGTRAYQDLAMKIGPKGVKQAQESLPGLIEDLQAISPDIKRFEKASGQEIRTPEEYGLVAGKLREQWNPRFYEELQKPHEATRLQVSPSLAKYTVPGQAEPLGPYPTVGELNEALNKLNEKAGPGYKAGANAFEREQVATAKAQANETRQLLNEHLAQATGRTPEEIGAARERGGQLKNVAENAQARAIANRMPLPESAHNVSGMLFRGAQNAIGLPEHVANYQFRRAFSRVPEGTPAEFPDISANQPVPGAQVPPWFSPKATEVGPEPAPFPAVHYTQAPDLPEFAAPALKWQPKEKAPPPASIPRLNWQPKEPEPPRAPAPGLKWSQRVAAAAAQQFRGPEKPLTEAPPLRYSESGRTEPAPPQVRPKRRRLQ